MFNKIKKFVKEYQYEIILIGGTALLGGIATYCGYKAGKSVGYCKGIEQGAGNTLIDVAIGKVAGCDVDGKTYEFISKETTKEDMFAKEPTLEFCANRYTCTRAEI